MAGQLVPQTFLRRVGWLALIWATSVLALAVVAGLSRGLMTLAGLPYCAHHSRVAYQPAADRRRHPPKPPGR